MKRKRALWGIWFGRDEGWACGYGYPGEISTWRSRRQAENSRVQSDPDNSVVRQIGWYDPEKWKAKKKGGK